MFKIVNIEDLNSVENIERFKLCYIDTISKTIYDWDKESQEIINRPEFSWNDDLRKSFLRTAEFPNPDFVRGEKELYAYFTEISLENQWGDDWDDAPYEHNAGEPYDDSYDENDKRIEHIILQVPFFIKSYDYKLPSDWGGCNSPFAVDDINSQAVAWIFDYHKKSPTAILAGVNPLEFVEKLKRIENNHPDYKLYDEDDY